MSPLDLLDLVVFFAPMYVANGIPVVIKNVPIVSGWDTPLWEARLGRNKTIRGLVSGILAAMLMG